MSDLALTEPRRRPIQARSKVTVDAILEATAQVLVQEGPDRFSTNRVAKRAGVSVGTLYQYFPNKDALLDALLRDHASRMLARLAETAAGLPHESLEQAVRSYVRAMIAAHADQPELHRVLTAHALSHGLAHVQEVEVQARALLKAWLQIHADAIAPTNHEAAAFVLVTAAESVVHAWPLYRPDGVSEAALEAELCAMVLRYLQPGRVIDG